MKNVKKLILLTIFLTIANAAIGQSFFNEDFTYRSYTIGNRAIFQQHPASENGWVRAGIGHNIRWNNADAVKKWEVGFGSAHADFALINFGSNGSLGFYNGSQVGTAYDLNHDNLVEDHLRLLIHSNGNIGINTGTPRSKLHIKGSSERMIFEAEAAQVENSARIGFWELPATSNAEEAHFAIQYDGKKDMLRFKGKVRAALDQDLMVVNRYGAVGIGTILSSNPHNYKLAVNGTIGAKEVKVEGSSSTWADFVFEDHYSLPTLQEVESHIREKGHLKDIPSAQEVGEHGINLGEMDAKLLQKIEELTLYMIEQEKKLEKKDKEIKKLREEQESIKALLQDLLSNQ